MPKHKLKLPRKQHQQQQLQQKQHNMGINAKNVDIEKIRNFLHER